MVSETENEKWFNAASSGNLKEISKLIESGIQFNSKDKDGKSALILAAEKGHTDIVNFLLGVDSKKVLDLVLEWKNDEELCEKLAKQWKSHWIAVDINARDKTRKTALWYAVDGGHYETAKLLIDAGVDVNTYDLDDCTPLLIAVEKGYTEMAKWLIDAGADVNISRRIIRKVGTGFTFSDDIYYYNEGGNSALISAVENGRVNLTRWLVKAGADVSVKDKYGETALEIATSNKFYDIAEILEKAKGNTLQNTTTK